MEARPRAPRRRRPPRRRPHAVAAPRAAAPPPARAAAARGAAGAPVSAAEQRAYDAALDQFKRGDYNGAIAGFQTFVKTYPRSLLASSAQYWIGNAQFARKDYRAADRVAAHADPGVSRQPQGARRAAQHRDRAIGAGRQRGRAAHARGADRPSTRSPKRRARRSSGSACADVGTHALQPPAARRKRLRGAARRVAARHGRHDLPWQDTRDPYRIWLSEDHAAADAGRDGDAVLPALRRGVSRRARARRRADRRVLAHVERPRLLPPRASPARGGAGDRRREHGGAFPRDAATLATLPGIGRSTAAAIAAFAYGERNAILDGNVKRVLARHRGIAGCPGAPKVEALLWRVAEALLPDARHRGLHAGDDGPRRDGVHARAPRCDVCPVRERLRRAHASDRIGELPAPRPRKALPQRDVRVLLIERGGEMLLEKRPPLGIWGGLWCLPELPLDDDARAVVRARFGADVDVRDALPPIEHGFTHFALTMHPQRMRARDGRRAPKRRALLWLDAATTRCARRCRRRSESCFATADRQSAALSPARTRDP